MSDLKSENTNEFKRQGQAVKKSYFLVARPLRGGRKGEGWATKKKKLFLSSIKTFKKNPKIVCSPSK